MEKPLGNWRIWALTALAGWVILRALVTVQFFLAGPDMGSTYNTPLWVVAISTLCGLLCAAGLWQLHCRRSVLLLRLAGGVFLLVALFPFHLLSLLLGVAMLALAFWPRLLEEATACPQPKPPARPFFRSGRFWLSLMAAIAVVALSLAEDGNATATMAVTFGHLLCVSLLSLSVGLRRHWTRNPWACLAGVALCYYAVGVNVFGLFVSMLSHLLVVVAVVLGLVHLVSAMVLLVGRYRKPPSLPVEPAAETADETTLE